MGRPLSKDLLNKMNVKVSTDNGEKTLLKQVGYNKYLTNLNDNTSIVTLNDTAKLFVKQGEENHPVIKIVRNLFQTNDGLVFAYKILDEGGVKLLDETASLNLEEIITETVNEQVEETVNETVNETVKNSTDEVLDETASLNLEEVITEPVDETVDEQVDEEI